MSSGCRTGRPCVLCVAWFIVRCSCRVSFVVSAADNHTSQDAPDAIVFGGVDKRVHRYIYVRQTQRNEVSGDKFTGLPHVFNHHHVDAQRKPANDEKRADDDHGFDDVPLDSFGLGLLRTLRRTLHVVSGHHAHLLSHHDHHVSVAVDEHDQRDYQERDEIPNSVSIFNLRISPIKFTRNLS